MRKSDSASRRDFDQFGELFGTSYVLMSSHFQEEATAERDEAVTRFQREAAASVKGQNSNELEDLRNDL